MTRGKPKVAATRHAKHEWSLKRKVLAVTLSITLLGLGTPAVSFADSAADQQSKAVEAQETTSTVSVQEQAPASAEPVQQVAASAAALGDAAVDNDVAVDAQAEGTGAKAVVDGAADNAATPASNESASGVASKNVALAPASSDDQPSDKASASTEAASKDATPASETKDGNFNDQVNAASNEAVTAAEYTVGIGESITIFGSGSLWESSWASEGSAATVAGNGNKATVTGVSAGDATVTYTYKSVFLETKTQTFVIHVVDARPKISIEGDLVVGGKIKLSVQNFENADAIQWASDNTKVATIDSDGVVEGISVGKANITASAGSESATKQIEVKRNESNGGYYVYLYTKVEGSTTGLALTVNKDGWYTIGRVWVNDISAPTYDSTNYVISGDDYDKVMAALGDPSNVDLYGVNSINLEDIEWSVSGQSTGLKTASGASDYDTSNNPTWHLDGYVNFDKVGFGSVVFHYKDADTGATLADDETVTAKETKDFDFSKYIISIEGYTYDKADPSPVVVVKRTTKDVTLYYKKSAVNYTVYYKEKDTEKELASPKTATASYGSTVTENAVDIRGYKVDGKSSQDLKIDAQNKSITFHYVAKQGKVGYYLADSSATWDAPADTVFTENQKWYYNYGFAKGDTVQVTNVEPSAMGKAFIGWLDKERGSQSAAIREAGDTIIYIYSGDQSYTLDALWASLAVTGYKDTYDGKEHGLASVDIAINEGSDLAQQYQDQAKKFIKQGTVQYSADGGKTWSGVAPKYKDAGTYPVKVKVDVTVGNRTATLEAAANIVIEPATLTVTTPNATRVYNGQPLTAAGTIEGFVNNETAGFTTTGSQTAVGESENTYAIDWEAADATAKQSNYTIAEKLGTLKVTPNTTSIVVTPKGGTKVYDGTPLESAGVDEIVGLPKGFALTAEVVGSVTDAGYAKASIKSFAITNAAGEDVTDQFANVATGEATLVVTPRPVTVASADATKVYDGTELVKHEAKVSDGELVEGEEFDYEFFGTQTDAGVSDNTFEAKPGNDATKLENYEITYDRGALTVTPAPYSVTTESATKVYDGTALTAGGKIEGLLEGETANLKVAGSQTKVGASENAYTIEWTGTAKESNYKLESESIGTLTVTAAPDSPTPDDQSKDQGVFNGANSGLVQTGDATGIYGVAAIIAAAVAAFVSLLAVRRRKE